MSERTKSPPRGGAHPGGVRSRTPEDDGLGDGPIAVVGMACRFRVDVQSKPFAFLKATGDLQQISRQRSHAVSISCRRRRSVPPVARRTHSKVFIPDYFRGPEGLVGIAGGY